VTASERIRAARTRAERQEMIAAYVVCMFIRGLSA
jgi:hypothetical protein